MPINRSHWGNHQGFPVELYTLSNANGMTVKITNYGATITSISLPDDQGNPVEFVCGFDTFEEYFQPEYLNNAPYFGCTVGRYASRIKDGKFSIDQKEYTLAVNDGSNHLHGGITGFDKRVWETNAQLNAAASSLTFRLSSQHLEEGYPGNVEVSVCFTLTEENEIIIDYKGVTDQTTPLSLTNHTYFNLSGFKSDIKNTRAVIQASTLLKPDATNVPVGEVEEVNSTVADLRAGKVLGECFNELPTGFEHYYAFEHALGQLNEVATFTEQESNRKLMIKTTEPGALFYTGYFTSDQLSRDDAHSFGRYRAFCFETSRYPNGPNIPGSPGSVTRPGETYRSTTVFRFE